MKLGEGAIVDVVRTEAEALCPAIKVTHQSYLLRNAIPYNRDLAVPQLVNMAGVILHDLQNVATGFHCGNHWHTPHAGETKASNLWAFYMPLGSRLMVHVLVSPYSRQPCSSCVHREQTALQVKCYDVV